MVLNLIKWNYCKWKCWMKIEWISEKQKDVESYNL